MDGRREQDPAKLVQEMRAQDERMVEIIWRIAEDKMHEHPDSASIITETLGAIADAWSVEGENWRVATSSR